MEGHLPAQESVSTDSLSDKQQVAQLRQHINRLSGIPGSETLVAAKQDEIKAIEQKILASKPKSQIFQMLEGKVRKAKEHHKMLQSKVSKQKAEIDKAQEFLAKITAEEDEAKSNLAELEQQLENTEPTKDDTDDMDIVDNNTPNDLIDGLAAQMAKAHIDDDEKTIIENCRSLLLQKQQQQKQAKEQAKKEVAATAAASNAPAASEPQGEGERVPTFNSSNRPRGSGQDNRSRSRGRSQDPNPERLQAVREEAAAQAEEALRVKYHEWMARKVEGMSEQENTDWQKDDPLSKKQETQEDL